MSDNTGTYYLQKLDCNCNDCYFMQRDLQKHQHSLSLHHQWQLHHFETAKRKMMEKAKEWDEKGEAGKAANLRREAAKMKFQFNKGYAMINYGHCAKFDKPVSFIPVTLQLHTQQCFEHRKDRAMDKPKPNKSSDNDITCMTFFT